MYGPDRVRPGDTTAVLAIAYGNRGAAYDAKGLYDQAIADDTQAIALNPQDAMDHYNRGAAYGHKGLLDQAVTDYTRAIALDPQHANAYYNRGRVYEATGLHDQAIADYRAALKWNQTRQDALGALKRLGATP